MLSLFVADRTISSPYLRASDSSTDGEGGVLLPPESREHKDTTLWTPEECKPSDIPHRTLEIPRRLSQHGLDWCDRGTHVDFHDNEVVPLQQGRFLGHGIQGIGFNLSL